MNEGLQQSVVDAISRPTSAASVSVATTATGIGAYLEIISPLLGVVATLAGITLSIVLAYRAYMDIKIKRVELEKLEAVE
jgi:hypothetical protein